MKRTAFLFTVLLCSVSSSANDPPRRPRILGVALVRLSVTSEDASHRFYSQTLGLPQGTQGCFSPMGVATCFFVNFSQQIELVPASASDDKNALKTLGFQVSDAAEMRQYLMTRSVKCSPLTTSNSGDNVVEVRDPENHRILFISPSGGKVGDMSLSRISTRIIHAGFVVHDRAAEDKLYKDILGFHVYWHGGMKDGETDWVDMQVPDGTDWIEYMLNVSPSADKKELGVMNHIALGVPDIKAAREQLLKNGMKLTEEPQIGRDGKWQLNLYDPDDTRVELMEFTPVQKPCCSEYTGPHPKP